MSSYKALGAKTKNTELGFQDEWLIISRRSPKGHKLGSHHSKTRNKMKGKIKAKGSKVRIMNISGAPDKFIGQSDWFKDTELQEGEATGH